MNLNYLLCIFIFFMKILKIIYFHFSSVSISIPSQEQHLKRCRRIVLLMAMGLAETEYSKLDSFTLVLKF